MQLETILEKLDHRDGIWFADQIGEISYPDEGSDHCYQVEDKSFWFVHRNKCILALVGQFLAKGDSFLDVGAGNGFVARAVQDAGYTCAVLEPSLAGCINAKQRGLKYVVNGESNTVDIPEKSFDAIGIFDVLEHIDDRQTFLENLRKLLKPGGKLFVTVPAYQKLWSYEDVHAGHFLRYTRGILDTELQMAGFRERFSSYLFSWLVLPVALLRSVPYKLGKRQAGEVKQDHSEAKAMQKALSFEIEKLKNKKSVAFGTSVIAVYENTSTE